MQPIPLLICYSRSGGTLLSRCLQAMGKTFVASEVHPIYNAHKTLSSQASQLNVDLSHINYVDQVIELQQVLQEKGKQLILRDWSFIDFTPHEINNFDPSYQLTQWRILSEKIPVIPIVFVRDAIDIWISRQFPPFFFDCYDRYVDAVSASKFPIFKYESFCQEPIQEMQKITANLQIPFDKTFLSKYKSQYVSGDMDIKNSSRGIVQNKIKRLKRKRIAKPRIQWLDQQELMKNSNQILGYSHTYYDAEIELRPTYLQLKIQYQLDKLLGRDKKFTY